VPEHGLYNIHQQQYNVAIRKLLLMLPVVQWPHLIADDGLE